jgi:tetratricopeptide (TPR) repeat protein
VRILLLLALLQPVEDLQRRRNLGKAHYERGEYDLAVAELEKTLAFDAATGRDYFNLGMAYLQNQQEDRALAAFTTSRQMEPGLLEVDFGFGILHKRALRYPRALESLRKVAARDPKDPATLYNIAAVLTSMRRAEEAEAALRSVIALGHARGQNFYVSALFRYATVLAQRGQREVAQTLFAEFQSLRRQTPNVALTETALENGRYARLELPPSPAPAAPAIAPEPEPDEEIDILSTGCREGLSLALGDYDGDGKIDAFVAVRCGASRLLRNLGGRSFAEAARVAPARGGLFLDDENSGLPSLYVWGEKAHHLYRNRAGRFVDEGGASGIASVAPPATALAQDFDSDGQLDLLLAGPGARIEVLRNQGDGAFSAASSFQFNSAPRTLAAADFTGDGFPDVFALLESGEAVLFENLGEELPALPISVGRGIGGRSRVEVSDLDRDGWLDVRTETTAFLNRRGSLHPSEENRSPDSEWLDLDGDGTVERLVAGNDGTVRLVSPKRQHRKLLRIALEGVKTNRQALGAVMELKAGRFYRKVVYPGHPLTVFTGDRGRLDVVRITWTNGVIQNLIDVEAGARAPVKEEDRQASSCPFLYVWDGRTFRFLTDIVGRAPMGEILPDGSVLVPNPQDTVRIPKGTFSEREGKLVFQVTEELREQAYLDSIELLAIDRPLEVSLYANEKFSPPPFEPFRLYAVEGREPPLAALNDRGENLLGLLQDSDFEYVSDFTRHRISGFAGEHALILTPPDVPEGSPLWLLLSGWVYWPSSSSMKALSENDRLAPLPPRLQVKDPAGNWVTAIENLGLPSGINRTLLADLSEVFLSSDRRVRVVTNFDVSWDQASFAEPSDAAPISTRSLVPISADLHYRGFSRVIRENGKPDRYDYERLLAEAPWNAASGLYTSYGDVRALTSARDGRLVVMAPGDELTLTFDPRGLPDLEAGRERDYFLHVTGWAKDQDPNTRTSRTVEPLPEAASDGADSTRSRRVPALVAPLSLPAAEEEPKKSLLESLTKGTPAVGLRYRYELVEDGAFDENAHASTLRTVVGYRTLPYRGFSFFVQAQNVAEIGRDLYDNRGAGQLSNGVKDRPAVVDPAQTRMQQVYGRIEALDTAIDIGRREIAYGDHRFVGDVNWRQNHQAFDAIHFSNRSLHKTTLSYTYAGKVIRIDGGTKDMSSHFLNALAAFGPDLSLELFSYLLDYDGPADGALSSQSYGGKFFGTRPLLEKHRVIFEAQYAKQLDFGENPSPRDADYLHLVGGVGISGKLTLKIGRELLGGSPERGVFQTPLATLFKFNGGADKFLTTPPNGLVDWYASGEGRLGPVNWILVYHDFSADSGGDPYGWELDARALLSTSWKQSFGAQLALYREDGFGTDATKLWFWTEYGF